MILFFQAEDGIRDLTVTGVQTCALPISRDRTRVLVGGAGGGRGESGGEQQAQAGGREGHGASGVKRATGTRAAREIGRASCRERGEVWGGGVAVKKKRGDGSGCVATQEQ